MTVHVTSSGNNVQNISIEMQFKTTMRCHIPRLKINVSKKKMGGPRAGEDAEQLEPACADDGHMKWYSHSGRELGSCS